MTDQTMKELTVLKRLEKTYDLTPTTVMVAQTYMVVRDLLNGMTPEHAAMMRGIDLKGILAFTGAVIPKWDPVMWDDEPEFS
jgi:hypothetical protein